LVTGLIAGAVAGLLGLRPHKVVLGPLLGLAVGLGFWALWSEVPAAVTVLAFRLVSAAVFRGPQVKLLAERVTAEDLPFEARTRYVGTGYVRDLASALGGEFHPDVATSASWPRSMS
jgi:hypothetical protein